MTDNQEPVSGDDRGAKADAWREFLDRLGGVRGSPTLAEIERQAFFAGWEAHESRTSFCDMTADCPAESHSNGCWLGFWVARNGSEPVGDTQ